MIDAFSPEFLAPGWLAPIPLAWLLAWRLARSGSAESAWRRICDARLLALLGSAGEGPGAARWFAILLGMTLTVGLLAAAGPGWRADPNPTLRSAAARVILLDLSRAMLVQDLRPSRFAHARAAAREILESGFDGETAMVVYAGAAFTVAPLTRDAATLGAFLEVLEPGLLPVDGAAIHSAVARASELLTASISGRGQLLLLAGGVDAPGAAIESARQAAAAGHRVSVMAFGSPVGGPRVGVDGGFERDPLGGYRLARTDLETLARIARVGGGRFTLATPDNSSLLLDTPIDARSLVESDERAGRNSAQPANEGYWLVWLALPIAIFLFRRNLVYGLLLALPVWPMDEALAIDWSSPWNHAEHRAFAAYADNNFVLAGDLSSAPLLRGAARYRAGDMGQALSAFADLDSAAAHFNRANTLVQLERYSEAVNAYQQALERQPVHRAARFNLRLVGLFLEARENADGNSPRVHASDSPGEDQSIDPERNRQGRQPLDRLLDSESPGAGEGASSTSGRFSPLEDYQGEQTPAPRLNPAENADREKQAEVAAWIASLPAAASALFERKFLRDYQRSREGDR